MKKLLLLVIFAFVGFAVTTELSVAAGKSYADKQREAKKKRDRLEKEKQENMSKAVGQ